MRRRDFIAAIGGLATAWPLDALAQQASKVPTIGVLGVNVATWTVQLAGFTQRLSELSWIEGRSIAIEYRWSEGRAERVAEVAAEFVQQNVDVIVTNGTSVPALERATRAIPIVFAMADDPVGSGLVPNLAHPGGNITGMSLQSTDLASKRLEILREAVPNLHRLAIMANANSSEAMLERHAVEQNARAVGLDVASLEIRRAQDIVPAFDTLKSGTDALYVVVEGLMPIPRASLRLLAGRTCRQSSTNEIMFKPVRLCRMDRIFRYSSGALLRSWTRSCAARSPATSQSSSRPNLSLSLMSRPPRQSALRFRNRFSHSPTR